MDTKNIVYIIIFSLCLFFLINKNFKLIDILIVTIGIYCINYSFEKFTNIEGFTGNDTSMSNLSEIENTESNSSNLAEVMNDNQKLLSNIYDDNMKIINDNYIYKDDGNLLNLNSLSTGIKPVPGELESDINKISFYSKSGHYSDHEIDINGNIKDKFGNIVAQSDALKKFSDMKIDNYGNILDQNGDIVGEVGDENNIKMFLYQLAKEGKLENFSINSNGGIVDTNNNEIYKFDYLKKYGDGSIINKLGFIVKNNTILGHLGGDVEGLDAIIQHSTNGNLENHIIYNGGNIALNGLNIAKIEMLSKFDGNKIDANGYVKNDNNVIIGFIGGDEKAKDILVMAARNGEFEGFTINFNGSILDKEGKMIGQLEYLKRFTDSTFDSKGFILNASKNVVGHIGGPKVSLEIILELAKDGMLNGFKIDSKGNIINKSSNVVATFENLIGYPTSNVIDRYGNILNENNQHIGYIGGEQEAVNLANKYSDLQGRKFINGVLRRLQTI